VNFREKLITKQAQQQVAILVGARVRLIRRKRNLSQEQLAHQAGVTRVFMGEIERGETNPTVTTLLALAAALRVEVGEMFPPLEGMIAATDAGPLPSYSPLSLAGEIVLVPRSQRSHKNTSPSTNIEPGSDTSTPQLGIAGEQEQRAGKRDEARQSELARQRLLHSLHETDIESGNDVKPMGEMEKQRKRGRPRKKQTVLAPKRSTLIGVGVVARLLGVDTRTIERRIARGTLVPFDWVDGVRAVFRREDFLLSGDDKTESAE
jgi:transcriptional regulator with XRE-family HTH domain